MPSPPIQVFLTTIASQPALRQRQEYILRILHVKKIQFTSYDLASDEAAKRLWKRKAPPGKQQLPGLLIGNAFPGPFESFEEAVEYDELSTYLRLDEAWEDDEDRPILPQLPVGVPGAASPAQMTPEHHKPKHFPASASDSPLRGKPVNKRTGDFDISTELEGFGLQGVRVTEDDLAALVQELGLGGDEADDLVKGLSGPSKTTGPLQSKKSDAFQTKADALLPKKTDSPQPKRSGPEAAMMAELTTKLKPKPKPKAAPPVTPAVEPATKVGPTETTVTEQKQPEEITTTPAAEPQT